MAQHRYPIIDGIPRFIDGIATREDIRNVYADSFGHQWTTYEWLRDEDEFEFFQITDLKKEDLAGLTVLDAGCGGGRVARIMTKYCGTFIGFDYSIAVERAAELCKGRENAHFVQCDVNKHPFKPETFDFVYSHGVQLHARYEEIVRKPAAAREARRVILYRALPSGGSPAANQ